MHELPAEPIRTALLAFYDARARDLPWRRTREPYAILVSEVMAQQTRIDTVIPYWTRWMRQFPDVDALAAAPVDDVLKAWEGLGYYTRARNLHNAARVVRERHAGAVPGTYRALRALPGVGDYTAGAVASIAFGAAEPAVDGNVRRVLSRLLDEPAPSPALLRATAAALVDPARPGEFNQALMELGSAVCTPRSPRCGECPVAAHCRAFAAGTQAERPRAKAKKGVPSFEVATAVLRDRAGRLLLQRRPEGGLLGGMWAFPARAVGDGEAAEDVAAAIAAELTGRHAAPASHIGDVPHAFSHRREVYRCFLFDVDGATAGEWVGPDVSAYALPRAQQRIRLLALQAAVTRSSGSRR